MSCIGFAKPSFGVILDTKVVQAYGRGMRNGRHNGGKLTREFQVEHVGAALVMLPTKMKW